MITRYLSNITLSLLALMLTSGSLLISSNSSADDSSVDNVSISIPVSCTLSGTGMNSHNATIPNGTYQDSIGTTTLKAFCNDTNGFAIYANGYTGDTLGNNKLIGSSTSSEIVTGTATTTGSPDVSNWAMKLETSSSATYALTLDNGFGSYSSVPSSYTKVAHRDSGTDLGTSAEGATLTSTYAAYIAKTQPADSYQGQVIYTLVHPSSEEPLQPQPAKPGKIVYHPNNSSVVGTMGDQSASNNANVTLWAPNFKRTGYGFAGWNTAYDYSGTNYGPNQTITAPADVRANGLSLYAVWIKSAGSLQNWDGCSSLAQGSTTALTDERDGNTYAVAKLADGKCWTIENLRLADKDSSNNDIELSNTNTHNPSLPFTNSWWYSSANDSDTKPTSNHLSASTDPTTTAWCTDYNSACMDQSMLATNNAALFTNNTASSYSASSNVYSYGNYYNWYSATAGHGKYENGSGYVASGDICPAGWHLPKGGNKSSQESTNEFWQLVVTGLNGGTKPANYDSAPFPTYIGTEAIPVSNALRSYPNNFVYSGYVDGSSVGGRGSSGHYSSSSASNSNDAYYLYFYKSSSVIPGTDYNSKYSGRMVRCVAGV